jgi:cobalamin biosynthesis protein CobD/CbiB
MEATEKKTSKIGTKWLKFARNNKKNYHRLNNVIISGMFGLIAWLCIAAFFVWATNNPILLQIAIILAVVIVPIIIIYFMLEMKAMTVAREEMVKQFCPKDAEIYRKFLKEYP